MLPSTRKLAEHNAILVKGDVTSLTTPPVATPSSAEGFQVVNKRRQNSRKRSFTVCRRPRRKAADTLNWALGLSSNLCRLGLRTGRQCSGRRRLAGRISSAIHFKIATSSSSNPAGRSGRLARRARTRIGERATIAAIVDISGLDSSKDNTTPYSLNN